LAERPDQQCADQQSKSQRRGVSAEVTYDTEEQEKKKAFYQEREELSFAAPFRKQGMDCEGQKPFLTKRKNSLL
jgi:hypothetical protein